MKFFVHTYLLLTSFLVLFLVLTAAVGVFVLGFSFVFWTLPVVPSVDTIYFFARSIASISIGITIVYAYSTQYAETVNDMLSRRPE